VSLTRAAIKFASSMLRLAVAKLPVGPVRPDELKSVGYRAFGMNTRSRSQLLSRNGKNFAKRFVAIASALATLPDETIIDN
jgi:hypothetical protein